MYLMPRAARLGSKRGFIDICSRNLFTKQELGVTQFENLRQDALEHFNQQEIEDHKAKFINNFNDMRLDEKRDNLKHFILLIEGKSEDLQNLRKFLIDYKEQYDNGIHEVKEFCFGTPIMRLFYSLNLPDEAIKFYQDPDLKNHFEQMQTYKVMLSLLFENKRYAEVFDLYKVIRKRLDLFELIPDLTVNCLAFAVCYSLNSSHHYEYAKDLWKRSQHLKQLSRSKHFLAGLALKQNDPKFALELVKIPNFYVTVRFIQLMAYTQLSEFDLASNILHKTIANYKHMFNKNKPCFGRQMLTDLRASIEKSGTAEQLSRFNEMYEELTSLDLISDETLDQRLNATFPPMLPKNLFLKMKNKTTKFSN